VHHVALDGVSQQTPGAFEVTIDLAIGLLLPRVHERVVEPVQETRFGGVSCRLARKGAKSGGARGVSHGNNSNISPDESISSIHSLGVEIDACPVL
jgi:hypothetical protein